MNKASLSLILFFCATLLVQVSCKKKNDLNSYPPNTRLLNMTLVTSWVDTGNIPIGTPFNENYRFSYDNYGRVQKIYFTGNNPSKQNTINNFIYNHDTVLKRITTINEALVETDTFITDYHGHITKTYIQGQVVNYTYYNDLLTRIDTPGALGGPTYDNYTSYNGNFTSSVSSRGPSSNGTFTYYTDLNNRIGDYLYLVSMCRYSMNLYQNRSLINTIVVPGGTTTVTYNIDANQKITRTTAIFADTSGKNRTEVADLQYETY